MWVIPVIQFSLFRPATPTAFDCHPPSFALHTIYSPRASYFRSRSPLAPAQTRTHTHARARVLSLYPLYRSSLHIPRNVTAVLFPCAPTYTFFINKFQVHFATSLIVGRYTLGGIAYLIFRRHVRYRDDLVEFASFPLSGIIILTQIFNSENVMVKRVVLSHENFSRETYAAAKTLLCNGLPRRWLPSRVSRVNALLHNVHSLWRTRAFIVMTFWILQNYKWLRLDYEI